MDKTTAIRVNNLTKKFGAITAVHDVSFSIPAGEIYALIGENGAGKTTIIRMMTGLSVPDHGDVSLFGYNIQTDPEAAKQKFGYISDNPLVYGHLTGREFFYFAGTLRGMDKKKIEKRMDELVSLFSLDDLIDSPMSGHSRGNRQKIAFISSLLAEPDILIIDEPIVGLDPDSIGLFGDALRAFARKGGTVFFSTHILSFAKTYATRAGVIHKGVLKKETVIDNATDLDKLYHHTA